ncbi:Lysophospholipid acyltransferase [Gracilariopsis chorda]|uniref:Lysophospholipid acyltransferase n=1 Tax=Gracilariopsis chorda TaxID=448386 RepID=A0A2V3ISF8_9FLOR|nr:Lysophospholipid acyltransferase [Gracilariopsis chorda]|eukprot:PXF45042.1 Lysophospholipid acyltransferase [Gracilariopsis chorda]
MESLSTSLASLRHVAVAYDQALTPAPLLNVVDTLADVAAVTPAEVRLFLCLLLAYPVALSWRALPPGPSGLFRHLFSVIVGGWMLQFANGYQIFLNLSSCLFCYLLMHLLGPYSAKTVSAVAILILAIGHLYRQITDYLGWTLDWTLVAMVTTQKIMGLAYNIQDGVDPHATPEQTSRSVKKVPSLLEFLSFILFPANVVIGPSFEYSHYIAFATGQNVSPSPYLPGIWRLFQGLFYFVAHTAIALKFPCAALLSDPNFFKSGTFLTRYAAIWIALLAVRFKYYFGWKIAEGSACMSGLGFNGFEKATGKEKWDRVENVNVWKYETSGSLRTSSQNWNKTTNLWLRRYVYDRAPPSVNLYFTYLVSAFWHGFYPGYYMFFLSVAAATVVHRQVRRTMRLRFMKADGKTPGPLMPLYELCSFLATNITLNYFIMSFVMLAFNLSITAFKGFGFYGHWILLVSLILFNSGLIRAPAKKPAAKTQ